MQYLEPLFELLKEIRKAIYVSNAVYKILYLRIKKLKEKRKRTIQNWKIIQSQLIEIFGTRYTKYLNI